MSTLTDDEIFMKYADDLIKKEDELQLELTDKKSKYVNKNKKNYLILNYIFILILLFQLLVVIYVIYKVISNKSLSQINVFYSISIVIILLILILIQLYYVAVKTIGFNETNMLTKLPFN